MRRYKMAMQVTKNLQDLMNLDCVVAVRKCSSETTLHGCIRETVKRWLEVDLDNGMVARAGDWIVQDVCDHWCVMCPAEYEKHMNDEI